MTRRSPYYPIGDHESVVPEAALTNDSSSIDDSGEDGSVSYNDCPGVLLLKIEEDKEAAPGVPVGSGESFMLSMGVEAF
jgi:hypothetical protein